TALALRNAPHDMDGMSVSVVLQSQNARPARPVRIILDGDGRGDARDRIAGKNTILVEFVKAVAADKVIARKHQCLHAAQRFAHRPSPSSGSRQKPLATFSPQVGRRKSYSAASILLLPPRASFRASTGLRKAPV